MRDACLKTGDGDWTSPRGALALTDVPAFIAILNRRARGEEIPEGWVPETTFWVVENDDVVGDVDLRHPLNEWLMQVGGNIGYLTHPAHRNKGVASFALRSGLNILSQWGIKEALATCRDDNFASIRVLEKAGGIRIEDAQYNGPKRRRYLIPTVGEMDSYNPALVGKIVSLEPLIEAHAAELFPLYADDDVWTYVDTPPPKSLEALMARHRRLESRRSPDGSEIWLNWAVRAEGDVVGFVEATVRQSSEVEIAYFIGKRFWGQGFGTDAVATMLGFLGKRFPQGDFWATVDSRNRPSVRLLTRLGFNVFDDADPQNVRFRFA
jgi:ribosomal-protein-alanine N-acetyltransferase